MIIELDLTETQKKALDFYTMDFVFDITSMTLGRANQQIDIIIETAVQEFLKNNEPIPNSKEEIVAKAFELGYVKTAKIRVEEREKEEEA